MAISVSFISCYILHKETETNSVVYKRNRNGNLCLQKIHKQSETKRFINNTNINQNSYRALVIIFVLSVAFYHLVTVMSTSSTPNFILFLGGTTVLREILFHGKLKIWWLNKMCLVQVWMELPLEHIRWEDFSLFSLNVGTWLRVFRADFF